MEVSDGVFRLEDALRSKSSGAKEFSLGMEPSKRSRPAKALVLVGNDSDSVSWDLRSDPSSEASPRASLSLFS